MLVLTFCLCSMHDAITMYTKCIFLDTVGGAESYGGCAGEHAGGERRHGREVWISQRAGESQEYRAALSE